MKYKLVWKVLNWWRSFQRAWKRKATMLRAALQSMQVLLWKEFLEIVSVSVKAQGIFVQHFQTKLFLLGILTPSFQQERREYKVHRIFWLYIARLVVDTVLGIRSISFTGPKIWVDTVQFTYLCLWLLTPCLILDHWIEKVLRECPKKEKKNPITIRTYALQCVSGKAVKIEIGQEKVQISPPNYPKLYQIGYLTCAVYFQCRQNDFSSFPSF